MTDPTTVAPNTLELEPGHEAERVATDRLRRVHGPLELQATLLALLLPPGSKRALRAWQIETSGTPDAEALCKQAASLSGAARLPWFERLLARMALQPVTARRELLQATRRVMRARGFARPIDRLHWLAMRRGLGEVPPLAARPEANAEVVEWLESDVLALATFTAFLSRMIPAENENITPNTKWYSNVMAGWQPYADSPECQPPDAQRMLESLGTLQTLSWMQRPVVVRSWLAAAIRWSPQERLGDLAADALRLSCTLLDSPLPPDLAKHYITLPSDAAA